MGNKNAAVAGAIDRGSVVGRGRNVGNMGFIELNSGSKLQMERNLEEYAREINVDTTTEAFDTWTEDAETGNGNDSWDNELFRHSIKERKDGGLFDSGIQSGKETNRTGDFTGVEADSQGVVESDAIAQKNTSDRGVMLQIRMTSDNKMYVQADRQVIHGNDSSLWEQQIIDYVNESVRKGKDVVIPTEDI